MYVLIALALVCCTSSVHSLKDKPYLLASVLFYSDGQGETAVANKVPMKVIAVIKKDIKTHIANATVKVVPIFKDHRLNPSAVDLIGFMEYTYKTVLVKRLPAELATKLVAEHKKRLNKKTRIQSKKDKAMYLSKAVQSFDEAAIYNMLVKEPNSQSKSADGKNNAPVKFQPNSVYYSIETKCRFNNEECDKLEASITKKRSAVSFKNMFLKKAN